VETEAVDAHDEAALENFLSKLRVVDHLVSMIGDSMSGGFLTTPPETMRHVLHSKFWINWMIGKFAAPKIRKEAVLFLPVQAAGRKIYQLPTLQTPASAL
jgi:hypothetical protein